MIASFYGMNVGIPLSQNPAAFWIIVMFAIMLSAFVAYIFAKKQWL